MGPPGRFLSGMDGILGSATKRTVKQDDGLTGATLQMQAVTFGEGVYLFAETVGGLAPVKP